MPSIDELFLFLTQSFFFKPSYFFGVNVLFTFNHACCLSFLNVCVCAVCMLVYMCVHVRGHVSWYMFAHAHMEAVN